MTKSDTINILITYRERLKNQHEKPGWNKWALFGALASLIWVTIGLLEQNNFEYNNSIKLLITIILCENLITLIFKRTSEKKQRQFMPRLAV